MIKLAASYQFFRRLKLVQAHNGPIYPLSKYRRKGNDLESHEWVNEDCFAYSLVFFCVIKLAASYTFFRRLRLVQAHKDQSTEGKAMFRNLVILIHEWVNEDSLAKAN